MRTLKNQVMTLAALLFVALFPLLSSTGRNFEYEYALVVSILALITFPVISFFAPSHVLLQWRESSPFYLLLNALIISALTGLVSALAFKILACPCSPNGFFSWYVLQTVPTIVVACGWMFLLGRLKLSGWGVLKRLGLTLIVIVSIFAVEFYLVWIGPQKRITSLLLGHLHGPIYDNLILLDAGVVWKRVATALFGFIFIFLASCQRKMLSAVLAGIFAVIYGSAIMMSLKFPSQQFGMQALNSHLNKNVTGDGFEIHYRSNQSVIPDAIKRLRREASFHLFELASEFRINAPKLIHIYAYENENEKKIYFGGGTTDMTDVVTPSIHILQSNNDYRSLRHELVHAFASSFAYHGLGFHPNMAFTEGLAVAFAPEERTLTLHEAAATLFDSGKIENPTDLFTPLGFYLQSGERSYAAAGSLILFIKEKFGIEKVIEIYRGGNTEKVLGISQSQLATSWLDYIKSRVDLEKVRLKGDKLFREPSLFVERCPHSKIDLRIDASTDPLLRLRQPRSWNVNENYPAWIAKIEPENRSSALAKTKQQIQICFKKGDQVCLKQMLQAVQPAGEIKTIDDAESRIVFVDLAMILGQVAEARAELAKLNAMLNKFHEALIRQIQVRYLIANDRHPSSSWFAYLSGWEEGLPEQKLLDTTLEQYLRMRRMDEKTLLTQVEALKKTRLDKQLPREIVYEWYRLVADVAYRSDQFDLAVFFGQKATRFAKDFQSDLSTLRSRQYSYVQNAWKHL